MPIKSRIRTIPHYPKKGKLPGETIGHDYELEYGADRIEIHTDAISKGERIQLPVPVRYASADEPTLRGMGWIDQQWEAARLSIASPAGAVLVPGCLHRRGCAG